MNNQDIDRLLEQGLSGDPPGQVFRARVLADSTEAFVRVRRSRARWRLSAFSAAAVFIAAVAFLLGRCSVPQPATQPVVANATGTVTVPRELLACLDAARLFKQLGMKDRMNRALDCADRLLPREAIAAGGAAGPVFPSGGEVIESPSRYAGPGRTPGQRQSAESANRILATSLGGYYHAGKMD
jgi:hypothetical protein